MQIEQYTQQLASFEDYLVADIVKLILSFLDETSRRHARLVCTKWFNIINYLIFNIGAIIPSEIEEIIRVFGRYKNQIGLHFKLDRFGKFWKNPNNIHPLSQLNNLAALTIGTDFGENLSNLTALTALGCHSIHVSSLTQLKKLKRLALHRLEGDLNIDLAQLEYLNVNHFDHNCDQLIRRAKNMKHVIFSENVRTEVNIGLLRSLESLVMHVVPNCEILSTTLTRIRLKRCEQKSDYFMGTHLINLKQLEIQDDIQDVTVFPYLESLSFCTHDPEVSHKLLQMSNLKSLEISLTNHKLVTSSLYTLTTLTKLTRFTLHHRIAREFHVPLCFDMELIATLTNLTHLWLNLTLSRSIGIETLTQLTRLRELHIGLERHYLEISGFTNLTSLSIRNNLFYRPNDTYNFRTLTNLCELNVFSSGPVHLKSSFVGFDTSNNVTKLTVNSLIDDENWARLTKLTKIQHLELKRINHQALEQLTVFKNLTQLVLSTIVNVEYIKNLTRLQKLTPLPSTNHDSFPFL